MTPAFKTPGESWGFFIYIAEPFRLGVFSRSGFSLTEPALRAAQIHFFVGQTALCQAKA
jgi:hypothetical protein